MSDIEEEQARAIREASERVRRSDFETLQAIERMTRDSHCALCIAANRMAREAIESPEGGRGSGDVAAGS
ncbi:MAG: hypothetical protein U5R14_03360 [Gemmatimonadota bacterium]|nr:hypothetical protein [Gemmatimonadota bacterium]